MVLGHLRILRQNLIFNQILLILFFKNTFPVAKKTVEFKFCNRIKKTNLIKSYEIGKKSWVSDIQVVHLL